MRTTARLSDPLFRLRLGALLLTLLFVAGTVGYAVLEDLSVFDAFYMTLITISTVGFQEIGGELSSASRGLTACLIVAGLLLVAFSTGSFIESIVEGGLADHFGRRRLAQRVAELRDHWIICGYGRMGDNIEQARANLKAFSGGSWLFFDSSNALLYPIRELGYFKEKLNVEQDDNLSAEEKKKRLTEIEKKLEIVRVLAKYQGAITVE